MRASLIIALTLIANLAAHGQTVGTILNDTSAFDGLTLVAPTSSTTTYLVDNCGFEINNWESTEPPGLAVYLTESGQLIRTFRFGSNFNGGGSGGGVEIYSWEGELEWRYIYSDTQRRQHHDVEPLPNGNILILAWELINQSDAIAFGRDSMLVDERGVWGEEVVEVKPVGTDSAEIVWQWQTRDHLVQDFDSTKANYGTIAESPRRLNFNQVVSSSPDWLHCNSIDYNPYLDQIIISSRNFSEVWIIDHSTSSEEATGSSGGRWGHGGDLLYRWGNPEMYDRGSPAVRRLWRQHDARWVEGHLPDSGAITIFNNGIGRPGQDFSEMVMITPSQEDDSSYTLGTGAFRPIDADLVIPSTTENNFTSNIMSGASQLPNGHFLVVDGSDGTGYELDSLGTLYWQYVNPIGPFGPISQGNPSSGTTAFRFEKYDRNYPAFLNRNLEPGDPIEADPIDYGCVVNQDISTSVESTDAGMIEIYPNPSSGLIHLNSDHQEALLFQLFDLHGTLIESRLLHSSYSAIDLTSVGPGLYIVRLRSDDSSKFTTMKLLIAPY